MKIQLVGDTQRIDDPMSGAVLVDSNQAVWKTLGTIIGVLLTILGLPGLREDVAAWATWLGWVRGSFPWWILLAAAVVVFAVTWWPTVRRLRRPSAGVANGDRLAAKLIPLECELIPIWFEVDLTLDMPTVLVVLQAVNYLDKELVLERVNVDYFHLNQGPALENIAAPEDMTISPSQSRDAYCRRKLIDSEIRTFGNCKAQEQYEAAVRMSAKGRAGKREVFWRSGLAPLRIHGHLQRYT